MFNKIKIVNKISNKKKYNNKVHELELRLN